MSDRLTKQELKEDPFVESAYGAWDWFQKNRNLVLGAVAVLVVVVAGVALWRQQAAKKDEAARGTLAEASASYWSGDYVKTIQLADQVMNDAGGTPAAVDAKRMKADALFWQGAFDSAATLYSEVLRAQPAGSPMQTAVEQSLAFALESKKDYAGAAKAYESVAGKAPDRANAADFYLAAGRAYQLAGDKDKAKAMYEKVATEYKETTYARDAEVALGEMLAPSN